MYEVRNRSVHEHELYSFRIDRENLQWSYRANMGFLEEVQREDSIEAAADRK